jgi:hypothetical protein
MPGFIGGSGGSSSGTGGEILFPKEFIDPVTKLRVSQPENLIDTDFEYGLQPTKWETVELINNTPSFFSKGGDTTIPGIISVITNAGTREITVTTALEHGLAVGIPISVTGTKSITADGAYIINSIPNSVTFTYLCRDNQVGNNSIEDLYTSIITGEFFQGSQLRVSDSDGILTDGADISTLTVKTESTHGFGENTPFYFLNLNSTISQEFEAANTAAKSFDSSNSATAQTFDGSNTLSTFNIDWSNSATIAGATSAITNVNVDTDTFTVTHTTENFAGSLLGTPLYYSVSASTGYFNTNPRGVVFLKTVAGLGVSTSSFQVSETPDGEAIDLTSAMTGTFQLANQARTFAGNNRNPATETAIQVVREEPIAFDGGNRGYDGEPSIVPNGTSTILGFTGDSILVSTAPSVGLDYYTGAMVRYTTSGAAATGLVNNATYFVGSFAQSTGDLYNVRLKSFPDDIAFLTPSGGSGTQTFAKIGVSADKDIIHARDSSFAVGDMLEYSFPVGGRFTVSSSPEEKLFYVVSRAFDAHNYRLDAQPFIPITATGGTTTTVVDGGRTYRVHSFTTVGSTDFSIVDAGTEATVDVLVVAGGGGGGTHVPSGGGAGGLVYRPGQSVSATTYSVVVGAGGSGGQFAPLVVPTIGGNSSALGLTAVGGGFGMTWNDDTRSGSGGSGGGREGRWGSRGLGTQPSQSGDSGTFGFGNAGANGRQPSWGNDPYPGGGGGGAGQAGQDQPAPRTSGNGGNGRFYGNRFGSTFGQNGWFAGGGGGGAWGFTFGSRGRGGMGGGGVGDSPTGNGTGTSARGVGAVPTGENGGANTGGGGGGGGKTGGETSRGGNGGTGVVLIRYPITPVEPVPVPMTATGGTTSDITVGSGADTQRYRVHRFLTTGSSNFVVSSLGNIAPGTVEVLIVGGGGGSADYSGGGGGGEVVYIPRMTIGTGTFPVVVGAGGIGRRGNSWIASMDGQQSTVFGQLAKGGGGGKGSDDTNPPNNGTRVEVANGGGGSSRSSGYFGTVGAFTGGVTGFRFGGNRGGQTSNDNNGPNFPSGGGGGAGTSCDTPDTGTVNASAGGRGIANSILGVEYFWGGGGGGQCFYNNAAPSAGGNGGIGGGGAGAGRGGGTSIGGGSALNAGGNALISNGGNGGANTGGGGGGAVNENGGTGGSGGSGIVVIRYPIGDAV